MEPYDAKADVWSVGCVVQEIAEGQPPYKESSILRAMFRIATRGTPGFRFPTTIPKKLRDFCGLCFKFQAAERPSIDELLEHPFIAQLTSDALAGISKGLTWSPSDKIEVE